MENKQEKRPVSWKKKLVIVISCVLAFLLVCLLALYIWADNLLDGINRLPSEESTYSQEQLESLIGDQETVEIEPVIEHAETILSNKNVINILLVGQDRREGEPRMHSDAMILCTINKSTKTLTMTSFMRDMWVYIPDHYNSRMNVPYKLGGFDLLNKTLDYNFGVSADYNVEIDFAGFMSAIDAIGGVDIELTAAEAKYLNRRGNWDVEENQGWELTKGVNHLTGSQALAYSRIRQIGDDFGRTNRQRTVLTALIDKAKTLGITEVYSLIRQIIPMISTDMSNNEIMGLAMSVLPMFDEIEIVSQRIPMDGEYSFATKSNGEEVIDLSPENFEANKQLLIAAMEDE